MVRGGPFSCATSPAELWPLCKLPRVFDGVSCTYSISTNTHLRYDNPAKCPRALVPCFVVVNVACTVAIIVLLQL